MSFQGRREALGWLFTLLSAALFVLFISDMRPWLALLGFLFPGTPELVYPRATLSLLVGEHLLLVLASCAAAVVFGVVLGTVVTRRRAFLRARHRLELP